MTAYEEVLLNKQLQAQNRLNQAFHMNKAPLVPKIEMPPKKDPVMEQKEEENELNLPLDKLLMHVRHYKTQIVSQLRSAVISGKFVHFIVIKVIFKPENIS